MGENTKSEILTTSPRLVICIGDIHGYISKLRNLWAHLQSTIPPPSFQSALIIFLGDYCDRGPDTRAVLDFLISLPDRFPAQSHVFLCGNHDLAFAAFVGALPTPPDGSPFSATWPEYEVNEEREGWFKGDGYERMHVQGRRWGGSIKARFNEKKGIEYKGSIYDAGPTFESYGVLHGSADMISVDNLRKVMVRFEAVSGLKINVSNSELLGIHVDRGDLSLARCFGCKVGDFRSTYCGLLLCIGKPPTHLWNKVIERIEMKLASWSACHLSYGGHLAFLKMAFANMLIYSPVFIQMS